MAPRDPNAMDIRKLTTEERTRLMKMGPVSDSKRQAIWPINVQSLETPTTTTAPPLQLPGNGWQQNSRPRSETWT